MDTTITHTRWKQEKYQGINMNISHVIYLILIAVIIGLAITIAFKNNKIQVLQAEKQTLHMQIAQAESNIKIQNEKIKEMAINIAQAESIYNENMAELQEKYSKLEALSSDNKTCDEIINIINQNQMKFLSGGVK